MSQVTWECSIQREVQKVGNGILIHRSVEIGRVYVKSRLLSNGLMQVAYMLAAAAVSTASSIGTGMATSEGPPADGRVTSTNARRCIRNI